MISLQTENKMVYIYWYCRLFITKPSMSHPLLLSHPDLANHPLSIFPRSKIIIYKDQVFDAEYLFLPPWPPLPSFLQMVIPSITGTIQEISVDKYDEKEYSLCIMFVRPSSTTCLSYSLTLHKDSYSVHLSKAQQAARRWLMRKRIKSKSWIKNIRGMMAFEKWVVKCPEDVLGKIVSFSLLK